MSDTASLPPQQARLKSNSVGLPGAVIMSAAIMGPAVSTFFNPQFSTPFSTRNSPRHFRARRRRLCISPA